MMIVLKTLHTCFPHPVWTQKENRFGEGKKKVKVGEIRFILEVLVKVCISVRKRVYL